MGHNGVLRLTYIAAYPYWLMAFHRHLTLDLRVGGNGDNWMRLAGLYTAAALRPQHRIVCVVPGFLAGLATRVFGDRLGIEEEPAGPVLIYETRGLKHLLPRAMRGERFIVPYHRGTTTDWATHSFKDWFNIRAFSIFNRLNWLQLPPWSALELYQGYLEIVSIAALRDIEWNDFLAAGASSFTAIREKLSGPLTVSPELSLPDDLECSVVVFPSGTGHQFMPLEWAKTHLPDAYYCFFARDSEQQPFRDAGLRILNFYREPADIVTIAHQAHRAVSTDSFASHLLQHATDNLVLMLAEFPRRRVVSPFFKGSIIDSAAPCSPCPHLERKGFPLCKAGYQQCLTWNDAQYTRQGIEAVSDSAAALCL